MLVAYVLAHVSVLLEDIAFYLAPLLDVEFFFWPVHRSVLCIAHPDDFEGNLFKCLYNLSKMIMRRFFGLALRGLAVSKSAGYFAEESKITREALHRKLMENNNKLNNSTIIKIMHILSFSNSQAQTNPITLNPSQLKSLILTLQSGIKQLNFQDLTLFLQILSASPNFRKYGRENPIMKQIVKKLHSIHTMKLNNVYIFRMFNMLQKMDFPPIIVSKYVGYLVANVKGIVKDTNKPVLENVDLLRVMIAMVSLQFVPIGYVRVFFEEVFQGRKFRDPVDLAYLYYLRRIAEDAIKGKGSYFKNKAKFRDLVFNPYGDNQEINKNQQISLSNQQQQQQQQKQINSNFNVNASIDKDINQLVMFIHQKIDLESLQAQLQKIFQFEQHPLTNTTAILLSDIPQMHKTILNHIEQSYKTMKPRQFASVIKSIAGYEEKKQILYWKYRKQMWEYLGLEDKLLIVDLGRKCFNVKMEKGEIIRMLKENEGISSDEFSRLGVFLKTSGIGADECREILDQVERIIDGNKM